MEGRPGGGADQSREPPPSGICTLPRSSSAGPGKLRPGWARSPPSSSARQKQSHSYYTGVDTVICSHLPPHGHMWTGVPSDVTVRAQHFVPVTSD
jgi:hypothetical protein